VANEPTISLSEKLTSKKKRKVISLLKLFLVVSTKKIEPTGHFNPKN
jgi:hypothetical protein